MGARQQRFRDRKTLTTGSANSMGHCGADRGPSGGLSSVSSGLKESGSSRRVVWISRSSSLLRLRPWSFALRPTLLEQINVWFCVKTKHQFLWHCVAAFFLDHPSYFKMLCLRQCGYPSGSKLPRCSSLVQTGCRVPPVYTGAYQSTQHIIPHGLPHTVQCDAMQGAAILHRLGNRNKAGP